MNDSVLSVLRAKFDAVSPKRPKVSIFAGFFRKTRKMNDGVRMYSERYLTERYGKNPKISIFEGFFRKTRKISDGVLSVLRVKFDAVLRKKTQKSSFDQSDNIVIRNNYHKKHK